MSDNEASTWRILGKRWTLPILKIVGSKQAVRFNEIKKTLAGISSTMLCERLLELKREGLLAKNLHGSKIEYSLTSSARELEFIMIKLDTWRDRHGRACQTIAVIGYGIQGRAQTSNMKVLSNLRRMDNHE